MEKKPKVEVRVTINGKPVGPKDPAYVKAIEGVLIGLGYSTVGREELDRVTTEMEIALMMANATLHLEGMLEGMKRRRAMLDQAVAGKPAAGG